MGRKEPYSVSKMFTPLNCNSHWTMESNLLLANMVNEMTMINIHTAIKQYIMHMHTYGHTFARLLGAEGWLRISPQ